MMDQFYMTLPSNSARENTAANFITSLPININLVDNWQVGLAEFMYGNTWFNIKDSNNTISFYHSVLKLDMTLTIATGRYESYVGLLETISKALTIKSEIHKIDLERKIYFAYNDTIKRCQMMIDTDEIHNFTISADIA